MEQIVRTRELTAEAGDGDPVKHVTFALYDRHLKRLLRPDEVVQLGVSLSANGQLMRHSAGLHWIDGQPGPAPVLLSQDVGGRYGLCVKCAGG